MEKVVTHDPVKEINEIRNQLSYSKRIGFFLGAGTSKAIGISDITELTVKVEGALSASSKDDFNKIKKGLQNGCCNIEDILNQIRLIRQITFEDKSKSFDGVSGEGAKKLDMEICNKIYEAISKEEHKADLSTTQKFVSWLNWLSRDFSKEIFTSNYDLILERAFESLQIPYFDGFVGANEPFFLPESLEGETKYNSPPISWIRLWKIHGSLGWFWKSHNQNKTYRVVRLGIMAKKLDSNNELVIYPSREKYEASRKQPFIAYFDRLRTFLQSGEGLFVISGFSFSDEHTNAIIFDSLRQNNRLHILGFFYTDEALEKLYEDGNTFMNFSAFGPKKAIIKGILSEWHKTKSDPLLDKFWDEQNGNLKLGDFKELVTFLLVNSGKLERIEKEINLSNEK